MSTSASCADTGMPSAMAAKKVAHGAFGVDDAEEPEAEREDLDEQQADDEVGHREEERRERRRRPCPYRAGRTWVP